MKLQFTTVIFVSVAVLLTPFMVPGDCTAAAGLGAKIGLAFAKQNYSYAVPDLKLDNSYRQGLGFGVFIEQPLIPSLAVRAEGMFVQKGFKVNVLQTDYNGSPIPRTTDLKYRIDYFALDLLGKASFPSGTYLMAGPRLDLKLSTKQSAASFLPQELEDKFSSTIFGWTLGVGQSLTLTPKIGLFVEGQYYLDQGKLYDKSDNGITSGSLETIKNKAFAFYAGIRF